MCFKDLTPAFGHPSPLGEGTEFLNQFVILRAGRRRRGLLRLAEDLFSPHDHCRRVRILHCQAFFRARVDAGAARDAAQPVDFPGLLLAVHDDGGGGALFLAQRAHAAL